MTKNMTEGSPMKLILGFSIPMLFGMLFQQFYNLVDMNTGFRIDVAYNEETDILSFSPNGDYIRVNTDETANGEKKKEQ